MKYTEEQANKIKQVLEENKEGLVDLLDKSKKLTETMKSLNRALSVLVETEAKELPQGIAEFLSERCQTGRSCSVGASELYNAFREFILSSSSAAVPHSQAMFGRAINSLTWVKRRRGNGGMTYHGLKLK